MIKLKNVTKNYDHLVLNDINYTFEPGKIYVLKGISGSGKSTLLNIISGLETNYDGKCTNDCHTISYIFQKSYLISHLTVLDNLKLINSNEKSIEEIASYLKIQNLLTKNPIELSMGEKQRVSIARASLNNPDLILADEPSASLDLENSIKIAKIFNKLIDSSKIIIISTHEDCFDEFADEIIYLSNASITNKKNTIVRNYDNSFLFKKNSEYSALNYSINKIKKNWSSYRNFSITVSIFMLLIQLFIGINSNFKNEYIKYQFEEIPLQMAMLDEIEIDNYRKQGYKLDVYENYKLKLDQNSLYPYYSYEDSYFKIKNTIEYGQFPRSENEVLVNYDFIEQNYGIVANFNDVLGKEIYLEAYDLNFKIVGIMKNQEEDEFSFYNTNPYFDYKENESIIFINYDLMSLIGTNVQRPVKVVSFYDLKNQTEIFDQLHYLHKLSYYQQYLSNNIDTMKFISLILTTITCSFVFISLFFIYKIIKLQQQYRSNELFYLHRFNIDTKKIQKICTNHYLILIGIPSFLSFIIYNVVCIFIKLNYSISLFLSIRNFSYLIFVILVWYYLSIYYPTKNNLKKLINLNSF